MSLGNLFGSGSSNSKDLNRWSSPFVNPGQFTAATDALSTPSTYLQGFSGGGLTGSFSPTGAASVSADASRMGTVNNIASTYGDQATQLKQLMGTVAPGFSDMRAAYLQDNTNRQNKAISDLSANLSARRVQGSSFAANQIGDTAATFGAERAQELPQIYLQELAATNNLLNEQHAASVNQYTTALNESNLEAGVAGGLGQEATQAITNATTAKAQILGSLANTATTQSGQNARTQAQLDASAGSGAGSFISALLTPLATAVAGPIGGMITGGLTSMFGGGATTNGWDATTVAA
jgi:hypothetical protein